MNIVVLGPGAIGSLWAYHLNHAGHRVSVWAHSHEPRIEIKIDNSPSVLLENKNVDNLKHADLVLITVKAWQVETALIPLLSSIHQDAILVFMHNGMGADEVLPESVKEHPIVYATTSHGALKSSVGHIRHTGLGKTVLGGKNGQGTQCHFLADTFNHALSPVEWDHNIVDSLWLKLAVNCIINPLSAIHQCKNGELLNTQYQPIIKQLIEETYQVMVREGIPHTRQTLTSTIMSVINSTAQNLSSMNRDIFYRRPTEIDFITGYLINKARIHNVAVPQNEKLYNQIIEIERNKAAK
ncbi:2-dehydropantoate 2-reductase [Vibrio viridaestus]|uniref:2-dehydropantoate 2-reductase n=1 Tax=Vibrio viridaestus TaxID=2487322 RepID=A0A3N9TI61_9VIBR|nr:2-dehydropantoate 2-reductase [Vibrio viridaestus]RQW63901.1 2-dehydropantoate 2-reductase [Vibrio viridaestus]